MKRILRWAWPATPAALIVVAALGLSGSAGAASPQITPAISSSPDAGVSTAYTTDLQTAYVSYHVTFTRATTDNGSALTHATSSIPVTCNVANTTCTDIPLPAGSKIVFVSAGCSSPVYRPSNTDRRGVTCALGSLKSTGTVVDYTVVVQTPRSTDGASTISAAADLIVKEGTSDSQPQSNYIDTFFTTTITNPLSSDITSSFYSFTNPADTDGETFLTDQTLGNGNPQSTKVNVPSPNGLGIGVLVHLSEGRFSCPTTKLTCFGQLSTIEVGGSAPNGGLFACNALDSTDTNCLQFTVVVAGSSLTSPVNPTKVQIFHTYVNSSGETVNNDPVPRCSTKTRDGAGDCIVSVTQNKTTNDITWIARGPGNGGWGGAG